MRYEKLTEAEKARHPSVHYIGSAGFWKNGRCARCSQYIYNLSKYIGRQPILWR